MSQLENFRLKVFRTVAKHLSFRKAAEHLFLTQPGVTLQIKALEDDLGVRLFDRSANGILLTPRGALLLRYAKKIEVLVSKADQELAASEGRLSGDLSLGVSTTIAQYVLPRLIGAFLGEHRLVKLSLQSGNTELIVRLLLEDKISIGLIEGPARHREVRAEPFMEDELVLIASPHFELDRLACDQMPSVNLLMREQGSGSRRVVETSLGKAGIKLKAFTSVLNLDSTEAIKSAVEAGLGVGFVSRWAITKELELRLVKIVEVAGVRAVRNFTLISRNGPAPRGTAGAFRVFALERARLLSAVLKKNAGSGISSR